MNETLEEIVKDLENPFVAFLVFFVSMIVIGIVVPSYWIFLFSVVWSYLLSDVIINIFIVGGKGIAQIPLSGDNLAKHKGAYLHSFLHRVNFCDGYLWFNFRVGSAIYEILRQLVGKYFCV